MMVQHQEGEGMVHLQASLVVEEKQVTAQQPVRITALQLERAVEEDQMDQ